MSIMDQINSDRRAYHECGGTILTSTHADQQYWYCDQCHAFTYDPDSSVPAGTNPEANQAAWDAGDDESPEAV